MVVLPKDHPLAHADTFPVKSLQDDPFIMLEKGTKTEITENYQKNGLIPKPKYTTFDDYAVLSMVENGGERAGDRHFAKADFTEDHI